MKKYTLMMIATSALAIAACTRPAPANPTTTATQSSIEAATQPYPPPAVTLTPPPTNTPFPTNPPAQATNTQPLPTQPQNAGATATQPQQSQTQTAATNTPAASPTATLPPYNPFPSLGEPTFLDPMNASSDKNWERDGQLPDNDVIRLRLEDGELLVTGRMPFFETWWYSWPNIENFFIVMDTNTGKCAGRDAYGLIIRGAPRDAGDAWGYIVAFTCDGKYMVQRLDSFKPFTALDLIPWTSNPNINTGSEQINRISIEADGSTLTIYANNLQIAQVTDSKYSEGRYGVFIMAGDTVNYTYFVDQIAYWDLSE
jgi:hypothetical protein